MIDYCNIIGPLAQSYWGEPNRALSNGKELRFGTHGSKSVDLVKGAWFDHETDVGGGAADLVKHMDPTAVVVDVLEKYGMPKHNGLTCNETAYDYVNADGEVVYQVVRYDRTVDGVHNKTYRQRRIVEGRIVWSTLGVTALPYRLPELRSSTAPVFITEGEKAADALADLGLIATTNHGGAGKWWPTLVEHFLGRDVIILPDNDEPGRHHARKVADALTGTARSVRIVELPGLPPKGDVVEYMARGGSKDKLTALAKAAPVYDPLTAGPAPVEPVTRAAQVIEAVMMRDVREKPVRWLVKDLIPAGGLVALYGLPGTYKSFVAMYIAVCIATGRPCFGRQVEQGDVVYVVGEGGAGLKARIDAIRLAHDIPADARLAFVVAQLNLRSTVEDANKLVQAIHDKGLRPKLIIIDTLARAFAGGNENESADMGAFITITGRISAELGDSAMMPLHHSGKDETKGMRGHSSLFGAVDTELQVSKLSSDTSEQRIGELTVSKQKDAEDGIKVQYRLNVVQLSPIDETKTSLSVVPLSEGEQQAAAAGPRRLTPGARSALDALDKAISEVGSRVSSDHIADGQLVVTVEQWRRYYDQMSGLDDAARRQAWRRSVTILQDTGTVKVWGEHAWRV